MARVMTDNKYYTEIANAIREKNGSSDKYTPAQMAEAILAISGGGLLPEGYTRLNYIESTGTQYIDTGFKPNQNTRVCVKFQGVGSISATNTVYGARTAWVDDMSTLELTTAGAMVFGYGTTYATVTTDRLAVVEYDMNKNVAYVNGSATTMTANTFTAPCNAYLFALNANGSVSTYATGRMFSCQIYDNGTLIRDFVPCRNPLGEVGLYDLVNGVFYGNAGSGSFIASLPVLGLPDGYTQVEYIESSGTQYIDTGAVLTNLSGVEMKLQLTSNSITANVFGSRTSATENNFCWMQVSEKLQIDYRNYSNNRFAYSAGTNVLTVSLRPPKCTVNTSAYTISGTDSFTAPAGAYIFHTSGSPSSPYYGQFKLFYCQIYDNGILIRDFVPCKNASGAFGLYDRASGQFYGNAGTGAFTGA